MEAEQVLQRLSDLEARIVSIEAKDGPVELDLDELKAKLDAWVKMIQLRDALSEYIDIATKQ
jgi:hypothetical protein